MLVSWRELVVEGGGAATSLLQTGRKEEMIYGTEKVAHDRKVSKC